MQSVWLLTVSTAELGGGQQLQYATPKGVNVPVTQPVAVSPSASLEKVHNVNTNESGGTQTNSKTLWKGKGKERIDVENPNPSQRPGQIHYQDNLGNKYIYDPSTGTFRNAPKPVNELLKNPQFKAAIEKGLRYLGL